MRRRELFVEKVKHRVVVDLKIGALHDEDSVLRTLPFLDLLKELLQSVN